MAVRDRALARVRRRARPLAPGLLVWVVVLSGLIFAQHPLPADTTELVSVASDGTQGNGNSWTNAISADGRHVVFYSLASNLVSDDTNGVWDMFVHDTVTGETERVSVASDETQGDGDTWLAAVSGDGRYVAFTSASTNLVAGDTNGKWDVFVRDRELAVTQRVSVAGDGTQANDGSWRVAIGSDGRYVAFESHAYNLVAGDTNGETDVFVHDRLTSQVERVSVSSDGWQGDMESLRPAISADGRYVAFESRASTLVVGDTNDMWDIFLHDRQTEQTERVSLVDGGGEANNASTYASVSADGRYVAFMSCASNLVAGDSNGKTDVFVYDRQTVQTERVSVASDGTQGNGDSSHPCISADGRYVAFDSAAANLVAGDTNGKADIFLHDRETQQTTRVSVASGGAQAIGNSDYAFISADGRWLTFRSTAANLVPDDTNGVDDVFLRARLAAGFSASPTSGAPPLLVDFTDLSTGGPTSWEWNFGDGGTSTAQHPSHEYLTPGSYTVTLTVHCVGNSDSEVKSDYIIVTPPPAADFSGSPTSGTVPMTVDFTDLSTGGPTSWSWDFGDGGASDAQHPSHDYTGPGCYTVSLTAANLGGSGTETKTDYISAAPPPPVADFSASPTSGEAPLAVVFTDLSSGDPTSWSWDFGDGAASTEQDPSHEYQQAGTYTVSLTAANDGGSHTETKTDYISITFADVAFTHWACEEILACVDAGIVAGYEDGLYHPDWPVDRAEMAAFISRALAGGEDNVPDPTEDPGFTDVDDGNWAYKYIVYAVGQNVISGYPEGDYRPDLEVTRDQMAVYIARSICEPTGEEGLVGYVPADPCEFPDVPETLWAYMHIQYCVEHGVVQGYDDGLYRPDSLVTRDQMAVYVARAFQLGG